jgi:DNA-binding MarR family transcriptional regulator
MVKVMKTIGKIAGAPVAMHLRGEVTDASVLKEVQGRPGSAVHEIAERLGWSNGRVDSSVNRLSSEGKVQVRHSLRRGMLVKRVYPRRYVPKPRNLIEIPRGMIEEDLWKKRVHVYALSRSTIALSPRRVEEWDKRAFRKEQVSVRKSAEALKVALPNSIADFYQLENSETSLSTTGDLALVTVESTALPVALPSSYPAEVGVQITRTFVYEERIRIEDAPSCYPLSKVLMDLSKGEGSVKGISVPSEIHRVKIVKVAEERRSASTSGAESVQIPVEVQ